MMSLYNQDLSRGDDRPASQRRRDPIRKREQFLLREYMEMIPRRIAWAKRRGDRVVSIMPLRDDQFDGTKLYGLAREVAAYCESFGYRIGMFEPEMQGWGDLAGSECGHMVLRLHEEFAPIDLEALAKRYAENELGSPEPEAEHHAWVRSQLSIAEGVLASLAGLIAHAKERNEQSLELMLLATDQYDGEDLYGAAMVLAIRCGELGLHPVVHPPYAHEGRPVLAVTWI